MLKKTITYTDFNDIEQTEDFYFNLSKMELAEMENSIDGGMAKRLEQIVASQNVKEMFVFFKQIILDSVGMKSPDGKRFVKSEEISQDFISSPAFDSLFMELASDADKAVEFVKGIMPKDLSATLDPKELGDKYLAANGLPSQPE